MAERGYWCGVAVVAFVGASLAASWVLSFNDDRAQAPLIFEPSSYTVIDPPILPHSTREFVVTLKNQSSSVVDVDNFRFAFPWAVAEFDNSRPQTMNPGSILPINVIVHSDGEIGGRGLLRFSAMAKHRGRTIEAAAVATLSFVQSINAEPAAILLGEVSRSASTIEKIVDLWTPSELVPPSDLTVTCDDPCIRAEIQSHPDSAKSIDRRICVARLAVSIYPDKAPDRLGVEILVRSQGANLKIPVTGFFIAASP